MQHETYQEIIHTAERLMSSYFQKGIHFSKVIQLSEVERRNLILRLIIEDPTTKMPQSIILKHTVLDSKEESEGENLSRFARDWAGIEFLTEIAAHTAPQFYAGNLEYKFILIEDLGETHPSLVGPLTRAPSPLNRQNAIEALETYVRTLGKMHANTAGKTDVFNHILKKIYPKTKIVHSLPESNISYTLEQFQKIIHIDNEKELRKEIQAIHAFVNQPNDYFVLLHGDICPDNVYFQDKQMKLIDFEYCSFGNALIDGTYLRMCMPTCWCSKEVPLDILFQMEAIYHKELKSKIVSVSDNISYAKNQVFACAYWIIRCLITLDEFGLLEHELIGNSGPLEPDSIWEPQKNASRPRILSRLQTFISIATEHDLLPHFQLAATKLLNYLKQAWPKTNFIELYPVFANK